MFITVQYNVTYTDVDEGNDSISYYVYGFKDLATIFFYMLIAIILHAVIQEYILDKINRRLHLSKTKHSKFNESGQLAFFYLFSFLWGSSILTGEKFTTDPTLLWEKYPHLHMFFQVKFFYICQIAYWLHALPELYFQKVRKEDIARQLYYICLYIFQITGAYILTLHRLGLILLVPHYLVELLFHASRLFYFSDENKQKGFTLWALLFVMARLLTLTLSVLTFGFGLARAENQDFSVANGNFNTLTIRMVRNQSTQRKSVQTCGKCTKSLQTVLDLNTGCWRDNSFVLTRPPKFGSAIKNLLMLVQILANASNGTLKTECGTSPRARKAKAS
ncbi:translocating chain-associated membrane protein 1-like isoform X3 [Narcine bancroftii]